MTQETNDNISVRYIIWKSAQCNLHLVSEVEYFQIKVKQSHAFMREIATIHFVTASTEFPVLMQERAQPFQEDFSVLLQF